MDMWKALLQTIPNKPVEAHVARLRAWLAEKVLKKGTARAWVLRPRPLGLRSPLRHSRTPFRPHTRRKSMSLEHRSATQHALYTVLSGPRS